MARLIDALTMPNVFFFIHVDRKVDISSFRAVVDSRVNCQFTSERYAVQWGGWNQVRYQLLFLRDALNFRERIDRIFVITGQDYPLWSNERIRTECELNPDKIWMKGINLTRLEAMSNMKRFLTFPNLFRDVNFHSQLVRHYVTGCQREFFSRFLPAMRHDYLTIDGDKWDVWQSSGYFSCNREQAQYILYTVEKYPKISRYFRYCFVPEEMTIPTVMFNSPFKQNAMDTGQTIYHGLSSLASLHEFFYSGEIKTYTEFDFTALLDSGKMFCRKVVSGVSDTLVEMINHARNGK